MGNDASGGIDIEIPCLQNTSDRRLSLPVHRPIDKIVPIGRPVQTAGGCVLLLSM